MTEQQQNKYSISTHTYTCTHTHTHTHIYMKSRKNSNDEPICRTGIETQTEDRLMDTTEEGEGGMNRESSIETYTLPCVKQIANGKLLYDAGSSAWCSVTT